VPGHPPRERIGSPEIGTGYFGCRTLDEDFDAGQFAEKASGESVKCVSLELPQGMRELSGGKPAGFKLCVGSRRQFLLRPRRGGAARVRCRSSSPTTSAHRSPRA